VIVFGSVGITTALVQSKSPFIVVPPMKAVKFVKDTEPSNLLPPHGKLKTMPPPMLAVSARLLKLESPLTSFPQNAKKDWPPWLSIAKPPSSLAVQTSVSNGLLTVVVPLIVEEVCVGVPEPRVVAFTSSSPPGSTTIPPFIVVLCT